MNSELFLRAFKDVDLDELVVELMDDFMIKEKEYNLNNLEWFLCHHMKEISTFYKLKTREELNKAQKQFDFMEGL